MSESGTKDKAAQISLRTAQPDDEPFLCELYASTRKEEVSTFGLELAQQEMFLKLQFSAQRRHYEIAYPDAVHRIILFEGDPVGRILVFTSAKETLLVDIALLAEYRGRGIGASLIKELIDEAAAKGFPVKLHVEKHNRAARLYHRLGFAVIGDTGVYYEMERRPILTQ